ncbi:hypothetical protein AQUCO_02100235v1 [Aquilegia coerulea]|uniref:Uncharacterized protein n=1 Tax=Aquilegia coerulea TaxID=218851 RepID=A0A2G5DG65_AQUCA|nr:hypothetical protein AQUCO_02100235v1 [Aquilegia coerulea]
MEAYKLREKGCEDYQSNRSFWTDISMICTSAGVHCLHKVESFLSHTQRRCLTSNKQCYFHVSRILFIPSVM